MSNLQVYSTTDFIKIREVDLNSFMVEWTLANGWTDVQQCSSEGEARAFALGLIKGFKAVSYAIGNGLHFNGSIEKFASKSEG